MNRWCFSLLIFGRKKASEISRVPANLICLLSCNNKRMQYKQRRISRARIRGACVRYSWLWDCPRSRNTFVRRPRCRGRKTRCRFPRWPETHPAPPSSGDPGAGTRASSPLPTVSMKLTWGIEVYYELCRTLRRTYGAAKVSTFSRTPILFLFPPVASHR